MDIYDFYDIFKIVNIQIISSIIMSLSIRRETIEYWKSMYNLV